MKPKEPYIAFVIFVILMFIGIFYAVDRSVRIVQQPVAQIERDTITQNTIQTLVSVLKHREGLRLSEYVLQKHTYIYYGHMVLKGQHFNHTIKQADSVLLDDVHKAIVECKRVKAEVYFDNIKSVFVSGKIKL